MKRLSLLLAVFLALPLAASAQQRITTATGSTEAGPYVDLGHGPEHVQGGTPVVLTHSASQTPTAGSVSCNAGGLHTDNSYWRAFKLDDFGILGDLEVNSIDFGVEQATGTGGTQPVEVRLYTSGGNFPSGALNELGTFPVSVPDQSLSIFNVPVTGVTVANGAELVVEVFTPNGQTTGNSFFIGSNAAGQTDPSYLSAADCGITTPTATGTIGFPNMHIIINVNGDDVDNTANEGGAELPRSVTLGDSYPNPFNPATTVPFTVDQTTEIHLSVYDALGREVAVLATGVYAPGAYTATFDAAGLTSGAYVTRLEANGDVQMRTVTLVK